MIYNIRAELKKDYWYVYGENEAGIVVSFGIPEINKVYSWTTKIDAEDFIDGLVSKKVATRGLRGEG